MNIPHSLLRLATRLLPTKTKLIVTGRQNLPSIAPILDVNELQCILREAEMGYCDRLFALYRDILASHAHTQGEFAKRKLAVLGDTFTLTSKNPKNAAEEALNKDVQEHLTDRPGWLRAMSHMLDSTLYPVSLMERWYAISAKPGWRWEIGGLRPVPHLHLAWPYGEFSLRDTDPSGYFTGTYTPPDPSLHIIHQGNLLTSVPDWWGGPMRALLFWWLFSVMDRDWWVRFLDRFGGPFLVGKHDASDEGARIQLEQAFSLATKIFGLAVTKDVDIQMMQANTNQGGDAFELFHSTANREISKLIVGQTLSAEGVNLGLGGGQAKEHADVREDIRQYDAMCLANTIRTQILVPLWTLNGWNTPVPHCSFGAVSYNEADINGQLVAALAQAGLEPTDEGLQVLGERVGYGLQRAAPKSPAADPVRIPLSATLPAGAGSFPRPVTLLPSVARRDARLRQARVAVDALVRQASPKLARIMRSRAEDFHAAILASHSPDDAAARIATLTASYDPVEASDLIERVLTCAAVNAAIAGE